MKTDKRNLKLVCTKLGCTLVTNDKFDAWIVHLELIQLMNEHELIIVGLKSAATLTHIFIAHIQVTAHCIVRSEQRAMNPKSSSASDPRNGRKVWVNYSIIGK